MEKKPWYLSKTLWLNTLTIIIAIAAELSIDPRVPDNVLPYLVFINTMGNIIFRTVGPQKTLGK